MTDPSQIAVMRRRGMTALAAAALFLVAVLAVPMISLVGAAVTAESVVYNSRFAVSAQVTAGTYALTAAPDDGGRFIPGSTGSVSFRSHPDDTGERLNLSAPDVLRHTITLPKGLVPGTLPAGRDDQWLITTWGKSEASGVWTVTRTDTIKQLTNYNTRLQSFPVTATADLADGSKVSAVLELPERFASMHSSMEIGVQSVKPAIAGVYGLSVSPTGGGKYFRPGDTGTVSFSSHPDDTGEALNLGTPDVMSQTITLPKGLVPGTLPAGRDDQWLRTTWDKTEKSGVWTVTRSDVVKRLTNYNTGPQSFPVTATADLAVATKATGSASLPDRFASAQSGMEAEVNATLTSALGSYDLQAKPTTGTYFTAGTAGVIGFANLPAGVATAPERSEAGAVSTHTVTVPKGFTVGTLPADQSTSTRQVRWTKTTNASGITTVVRTQTTVKAVAADVGREVLSFPVTANLDITDGSSVLVIHAPNPAMTSTNPSASTTVSAKTASIQGSYELEAQPTSGSYFTPGAAGTISYATQPTGSAGAVTRAYAGNISVHTITVPKGLAVGTLPADSATSTREVSWTKSTNSSTGVTTVLRTERWKTNHNIDLLRQVHTFAVTANADVTVDAPVSVTYTPLPAMTSTSPTATTKVPAKVNSAWGAYNVQVKPNSGNYFSNTVAGTIKWDSLPNTTTQPLRLRAGEALTTSVTVPATLAVGTLPADKTSNGWTTRWRVANNSDGTATVSRVETADVAKSGSYGVGTYQIPVTGKPGIANGSTIRVDYSPPPGMTTSGPTASGVLKATTGSAWGAYNVVVRPNSGNYFSDAVAGTIKWDTLPNTTAQPLRLDAGDALTHTVTVPSSMTVGTLPADKTSNGWTTRWRATGNANGTTSVTRTETADVAKSGSFGRESFQIPVTAKSGVSDGTAVRVDYTPPAPMTTTSPTASGVLKAVISTKWGVYNPQTISDKNAGSSSIFQLIFTPEAVGPCSGQCSSSGRLSFQTLPSNVDSERLRGAAGESTSYTIESGQMTLAIPATSATTDWRITWARYGTGGLVRTLTFLKDTDVIVPRETITLSLTRNIRVSSREMTITHAPQLGSTSGAPNLTFGTSTTTVQGTYDFAVTRNGKTGTISWHTSPRNGWVPETSNIVAGQTETWTARLPTLDARITNLSQWSDSVSTWKWARGSTDTGGRATWILTRTFTVTGRIQLTDSTISTPFSWTSSGFTSQIGVTYETRAQANGSVAKTNGEHTAGTEGFNG